MKIPSRVVYVAMVMAVAVGTFHMGAAYADTKQKVITAMESVSPYCWDGKVEMKHLSVAYPTYEIDVNAFTSKRGAPLTICSGAATMASGSIKQRKDLIKGTGVCTTGSWITMSGSYTSWGSGYGSNLCGIPGFYWILGDFGTLDQNGTWRYKYDYRTPDHTW